MLIVPEGHLGPNDMADLMVRARSVSRSGSRKAADSCKHRRNALSRASRVLRCEGLEASARSAQASAIGRARALFGESFTCP